MDQEITALKAQIKNPNRISVYLNGEYAFGLARIVAAWLRIGQVLGEDDIARLKEQDTYEVAYQRGLRFVSYRPRSEAEIQRKLIEQGFEAPVIEATIQRMKESGVLGDNQFARDWVENRSTFRPRSKRLLALELRQKGVAEETIQQALTETPDEESLAYQSALRYARRLAGQDWETFRKRLGAYLLRRGFSYGTMAPILRQVWDEIRLSDESANLTPDEEEDEWDQSM
jgi:regulatory protein